MAIKQKILDALNQQICVEFEAAYAYLSMAAYFEDTDLRGFSNWMKTQAEEELGHAMKIFDFLVDRKARPVLKEIKQPKKDWGSPLEVFENALKNEQAVTKTINDLANNAENENDRATLVFLDWFINEQVEEEASVDHVIKKLKLAGTEPSALFILDQELAKRTITPATP